MYWMGDIFAASLSFAIINPTEAYLTCKLIERSCPRPLSFTYGRCLMPFSMAAGFFGPALPSVAGAAVIYFCYGADFLTVLRTWFIADALGLLVVTPALLLLFEKRAVEVTRRSPVEVATLFSLLITTSIAVFSQNTLPILFIIPAIIVRIAFRLGPASTAMAVLLVSVISVTLTVGGNGPAMLVGDQTLAHRIALVQVFILVAFFTALPAASAFAEQTRLQKWLDDEVRSGRELAKKVLDNKANLRAAINNMAPGLCMYGADSRIIVCNEAFATNYGLPADSIIPGMTLAEVIDLRLSNGVFAGDSPEQYRAERMAPVTEEAHRIHQLNTGLTIAIRQRPLPGGGWVTTQEDITESRRIETRLAFLAHHDGLTGLANRVLLNDRIEMTLARVRRGEQAAVMFLDLDHFKTVNDSFGHATGDELLKIVADRLKSSLRETDTLARLGGDEFAILLADSEQPKGANIVAKRIIDMINAPFEIDGKQIRIGTSIGIATAPFDADTTQGLLKCADLALYKAKAEGRATYRFFEADMDTRMAARRELEHDLRDVVAEKGFTLHYQPLLNLATNKVVCMEALIRWQHPKRGMISPADFIPVAEETGLIVQIGKWVLEQACKDAARWGNGVKVSVNLSRHQLSCPSIVLHVANALAKSGLEPECLQLEITETAVMHNPAKSVELITSLRGLGIDIAMDDFGTGYSSLGCLRMFPFSKIKIDRSFINDLTTCHSSRMILRTIVSLARTLGMSTTAEGIETAEQLDIVRAEGCEEMQGYYYSRPKPIEDLRELLQSEAAAKVA